MKKKILGVAFCIFAAVMLFCVFAGCSRTASGGEMGTLELNKKYIHESDVRLDETVQRYFNFISADEGEYHYYAVSPLNDKMIYSYTITFHYKIVGEMVNCFFHSVEYDTVDTEKNASTGWSYTLRYCRYGKECKHGMVVYIGRRCRFFIADKRNLLYKRGLSQRDTEFRRGRCKYIKTLYNIARACYNKRKTANRRKARRFGRNGQRLDEGIKPCQLERPRTRL